MEIRARLSVVPQDTVLFSWSAFDNIRFGRPDAGPDEVRAAAKAARADEFLRALPQGYATGLGERGASLSGGQKQRIAIARAVLKDAPILLLDEATSALDAESDEAIRTALTHLMKGRTTLVIAHRSTTARRADRIIVMEAGRIVDEGAHEKLSARCDLYGRLTADPAFGGESG